MLRLFRSLGVCLFTAASLPLVSFAAIDTAAQKTHPLHQDPPQETGFLNRRIDLHGTTYRYQVYLPEEWHRDDRREWPIILALHGRGERGSEGMWQTQIGLPQQVRDHPERWPFIIVMPQCPLGNVWTDPDMLTMAIATLDQETAEFHADPDRQYLTGLSLGGYGAWELAREYPHRWAAIAIIAGGVFWSYAPERWQEAATLPAEYARPLAATPIWLFHGLDDPVVSSRESELMFDALKAAAGHVRLWLYQGIQHDSWTRAYNEPELPRWLLAHHTAPAPAQAPAETASPIPAPEATPLAERIVIPFHPPTIKLTSAQLDVLAGVYIDKQGHPIVTIFRQADQLYEKNLQGEIAELAAESPSLFYYLNGSSATRLTFEHDAQGHINALVLRDDRHEERWEKRAVPESHPAQAKLLPPTRN